MQTMLVQYIRLSNVMISLCICRAPHQPLSLSHSLYLQELQSEVSSLLEFKNALLNEFPHLHQKISNLGVGHPAPQDERRRSTLGLVGGLSLNTSLELHD